MLSTKAFIRRISFVMVLVSANAVALNPDSQLTQYAHTAWRTHDGAIAGTPQAVVQSKDGYLWIGTSAGLLRFNGDKFTSVPGVTGSIVTMRATDDGSLWLGTERGLVRLKNGATTNYDDGNGRVDDMTQDSHGVIWYARARLADSGGGPLCRVDALKSTCFGKADGIPMSALTVISAGANDYLWVNNGRGVARWKQDEWQSFDNPANKTNDDLSNVVQILSQPDGSLLVGMGASPHYS